MILREKDLAESEYTTLAKKVLPICEKEKIPCSLHKYAEAAIRIGVRRIHLPLSLLLELPADKKGYFSDALGVSVHSVEEALLAYRLGASYVTAGHIFATDCKKGVPPRGLAFLEEVCRAVPIPVYAIGGITVENTPDCIRAGAAGVCMMSEYMRL